MKWSGPIWSIAVLAPLVLAPMAAGGSLPAVAALLPSLTTVGQLLVTALGVFAVWAGVTDRGH